MNNGEKIKQNLNSKSTIKEIKRNLQKKFENDNDKVINLYYKGKELTKENESIGNICNNNSLDLVMVSLTMTESMLKSENKMKEKIISKLTPQCEFHNGDKELYICITCGMAFCEHCSDKHKDHKTLQKKEILKYAKELKNNQENIIKTLKEIGLNDGINDSYVCKELRENLSSKIEKLINMVDNIKLKSNNVYSDFKNDFDNLYPLILQYKDKVESLYEDSKKETTVRLEKNFVDFYCKYVNVKTHTDKINETLLQLKKKIEILKDILEDFNKRVESIYNDFLENYSYIKEYKFQDDFISGTINNNLSTIHGIPFSGKAINLEGTINSDFKNSRLASSTISPAFGRMNLVTLLSPEKKAFVKNEELRYKERKSSIKSNNMILNNLNIIKNKIIEENDEMNENYLYNIEAKTTNLIIFDKENKKISKVNVDLSQHLFKKFWAYHSTLNYKGKFYIGGGYATSKMLYKYNKTSNEFIRLEDMPSGHSYHRLIGINNFIFAISGFKSKKVEKYNIDTNQWSSLPSLEVSRSWPSCVCYEDKYIFLFGGLCDSTDSSLNNQVEKLDITRNDSNNKWERFNVNSDIMLPFYIGVVKINNDELLLLGGKYAPTEDNIDECFSYSYKENSIKKVDEYKLPIKDEFDGKLFCNIGNNVFGQFSAIYSDFFYIVDLNQKSIELIKLENNDS